MTINYLDLNGVRCLWTHIKNYIDGNTPGNVSDLTNDLNFVTTTDLSAYTPSANLATVATSGSYNDLTDKPNIPSEVLVDTTLSSTSTNAIANNTVYNALALKADSSHTHSASDVISGTFDSARIPNLDASKITSGTIDIARLPAGALERLVTVSNQTARFALTTSDVQLGDVVKQNDTGIMYYVTNTSNLGNSNGYTEFTAGTASSVPWSGITDKPSKFSPSSHSHGNITNAGELGTALRVVITNSDKQISVSSVTSTQLGYLSGVTSAIQTQINGKANSSHTHSSSDVTGLSTVATSGSYTDLTDKPNIPSAVLVDTALSSTSTNAIANNTVKNALDGKANSSHTHSASDITSGLATVATSGSYNDLSNKPTIPTVNNATLTIQKNGTSVGTFTANQSTNATINITCVDDSFATDAQIDALFA